MDMLIGFWKNDELGALLEFFHSAAAPSEWVLARYQCTSISLWPALPAFTLIQQDLESLEINDWNAWLGEQSYSETDRAVAIHPASPGSMLENFDIFAQIFKQYYAFFEKRDVGWDFVVSQFRPKITPHTTDTKLFDVFKSMISGLHSEKRVDPGLNTAQRFLRESSVGVEVKAQ